jgi:hypothetical protein
VWTHFCSCVGLGASVWLLVCLTIPSFRLPSAHFLTTLHTHLGLLHPIVAHLSQYHYGHIIDDLSTHLFWCFCKSEHIITRNTLRDIVTTIVLESGAHVQREVSHLFFRHTQQWVDIFITKYSFRTLMDVVIVGPTCTIWCNKHQWWQHMQWWWLLIRRHDPMPNEH